MRSLRRWRPTPTADFEAFIESQTAQSIPARFRCQVARRPDRLAVHCSRFTWSYHDLDRLADRLAHSLITACGGQAGRHVALVLGHGSSAVAAMLGSLKAGMVYVPLDARWPVSRLRYCLSDSQAAVVLTDRECQEHVATIVAGRLPLVLLEDCSDSVSPLVEDPGWMGGALPRVPANALAYVLYTSGSTGWPKGVMQSHENVLRHIRNYTNQLCISPSDRLSLLSSYSFDSAVMDIYGALLNGASLHPLDLEGEGLQRLKPWLRDERITIYHSTPTLYRHAFKDIPEGTDLDCLRLVVLGGEETSRHDVARFRERFPPGAILVNGFGPTECTLGLQNLLDHHTELRSGAVPIGYPVDGIEVTLAGRDGQPAEAGDDGEIVLRGAQLAIGYWGKPELTAEAFLPDPGHAGARAYRTGDLGRRAAGGTLEYRGRRDLQVKIRGHRVEVLEIEAHLFDHPAIASCAVAVDRGSRPRLVAYYVASPDRALEPELIREHLAERLPSYMIPAAFVRLDALPMTPSGKVDRRALSLPVAASRISDTGSDPVPTEKLVSQMWLDACRFVAMGRDANFFACGGDSLAAAEIVSRVQSVLGLRIGMRTLFENPSIRMFAAEIERQRAACPSVAPEPSITAASRGSAIPLSLAQQRYWRRIQAGGSAAAWNITILTWMHGPLQVPVLIRSLHELVKRHESLRTRFVTIDGQPTQEILSDPLVPLPVIDLGALADPVCEAEARRLADLESTRPFDLAREPSFRVTLLRRADSDHTLLTTQHHLITDGWSRRLLEEDLDTLYASFSGCGPPLSPPPIQYADFASWQQALFAAGTHPQLDYWQSALSGGTFESPRLPRRAAVAPPRGRCAGRAASQALDPGLTTAALRLGQAHGATLFMVLLTAFVATLFSYSEQTEIVITTDTANRGRVETQAVAGLFTNVVALRTAVAGDLSLKALLLRVRETALGAFANQEIPFARVMEIVRPGELDTYDEIFPVAFSLEVASDDFRQAGAMTLRSTELKSPAATRDLIASVRATVEGFEAIFAYRLAALDPATVENMLGRFILFLEAMRGDVEQRLAVVTGHVRS